MLVPPEKIYIAKSKIPHSDHEADRGVFAKVAIKKGEVIERCPVIEVPEYEASIINQTSLVSYIYYLGKQKKQLVLVLGYGSIYNHSDLPNAKYKELLKEQVMEFIATQDIKQHEEITVNYNQEVKKSKIPLWFDIGK